jgi:hypothetical protein
MFLVPEKKTLYISYDLPVKITALKRKVENGPLVILVHYTRGSDFIRDLSCQQRDGNF